jgi:hypothetical protein
MPPVIKAAPKTMTSRNPPRVSAPVLQQRVHQTKASLAGQPASYAKLYIGRNPTRQAFFITRSDSLGDYSAPVSCLLSAYMTDTIRTENVALHQGCPPRGLGLARTCAWLLTDFLSGLRQLDIALSGSAYVPGLDGGRLTRSCDRLLTREHQADRGERSDVMPGTITREELERSEGGGAVHPSGGTLLL